MLLTLSANTLWVEDFQLRRGEVTQVTLYLVSPPPLLASWHCARTTVKGRGREKRKSDSVLLSCKV